MIGSAELGMVAISYKNNPDSIYSGMKLYTHARTKSEQDEAKKANVRTTFSLAENFLIYFGSLALGQMSVSEYREFVYTSNSNVAQGICFSTSHEQNGELLLLHLHKRSMSNLISFCGFYHFTHA